MDTRSKPIDVEISQALIELKAELLQKQRNLKSAKASDKEGPILKTLHVKNESKSTGKSTKLNKNKVLEKELEKQEDPGINLNKNISNYDEARKILEAKAKLYEDIKSKALELEEEHPVLVNSLVDFQKKAINSIQQNSDVHQHQKTKDNSEWTEFTDSLGRTRRVLKSQLASYIEADKELHSEPEEEIRQINYNEILRKEKREQWDQQASDLSQKSKLHYQDILFYEIREHGTGYFGFSKDDEIRAQQLAQLKKLSQDTMENKKKIQAQRKGEKAELKERLKKIKARKRARLGLPEVKEDSSEDSSDSEDNIEKEKVEESLKDVESAQSSSKANLAHDIRAWDFGKPGVYGKEPKTFDELDAKWLKDRRSDRPKEFAPPSSYNNASTSRKRTSTEANSLGGFSN